MSRFTITVYQRKLDGQLRWTTIGLGPRTTHAWGKSATKLQRHLADRLRESLREATPSEVAQLELIRGRRLRRMHLKLSVQTPGKRVKVSGQFPVVMEPRRRSPDDEVMIAYHPERQEQWMVVDEERPLADQLRRYFAARWRDTPGHRLRELRTDGKDVLRAFSFTERTAELIDELPDEDEDVFADLEPTPAKEQKKARRRRPRYGRRELRAVGENVTAKVADRFVALGRPREPWRGQLAHLLNGPRKTPVVLVGPPGCGKSTLLHRWVDDPLIADDFAAHRDLDAVQEVWRLSTKRILAGMSHVGEWEKRVVQLAAEAADPQVVLWFDDVHALGRAGRSRDSDRTIADVLRGPLSRGELTIVGEATDAQWHRLREDAPALADRFTTLRVDPTDRRETAQLVLHEARRLEAQHGVRFTVDAYRAVLSLGDVLHPGSAQPGVAIDLARKLAGDVAFARSRGGSATIDADRALSFLARRTGLPEALLRPDLPFDVDALRETFTSHVLGQEVAVDAAVDLVTRIRGGLTAPDRPFATYLFTGPTGTGKTQMAKTIAGYLYGDAASRLVRIDMGEMSGPDAVARLIGDRYDPRGLLTDAVRAQPFCVVLLDEIEKAHRAVLQLLLQLLDEGRLTDASGDTADFTKTVIVMTSNLGARPRAAVGFGERADAVLRDVARAVRDFFPPELFNRIDRVVPFAPLTPEIAELVTEKELAQLLARRGLTDRKVFVFTHPAAAKRMAAQAFDDRGGARSVKRFLETKIGSVLSDELARASLARMRVVRIHGGADGAYRLHVSELTEAEPADAIYELEGLVDAPTSGLRKRLPALARRVRALAASDGTERVRERRTALLADASDAYARSAIYYLDQFLEELTRLGADLERRTAELTDVDHELDVDERRPAPPTRDPWMKRRYPQGSVRVLRRDAVAPGAVSLSREAILGALGEVALLENAIERMHEPDEHRVVIELLRVGRGRRPPSFDRRADQLFEWLATIYAGLRGEVVGAAGRGEGGVVEGALDDVLAARPDLLAFELEGVAVRSLLEGERGCHVWSSLLAGSEIVRVRPVDAPSARAAIDAHAAAVTEFAAALDRGDEPLPDDPEGLLPAVRRVRFDPPQRPGETALLELEDYVTGQVLEQRVQSLVEPLRALIWLRASRRRS